MRAYLFVITLSAKEARSKVTYAHESTVDSVPLTDVFHRYRCWQCGVFLASPKLSIQHRRVVVTVLGLRVSL